MLLYFFFFLAAGIWSLGDHYLCSRYPESGEPLSLQPGAGILNLFSGVPLHYELGDKVAAIPCWQGDNQYQVG